MEDNKQNILQGNSGVMGIWEVSSSENLVHIKSNELNIGHNTILGPELKAAIIEIVKEVLFNLDEHGIDTKLVRTGANFSEVAKKIKNKE